MRRLMLRRSLVCVRDNDSAFLFSNKSAREPFSDCQVRERKLHVTSLSHICKQICLFSLVAPRFGDMDEEKGKGIHHSSLPTLLFLITHNGWWSLPLSQARLVRPGSIAYSLHTASSIPTPFLQDYRQTGLQLPFPALPSHLGVSAPELPKCITTR